MTKPTSELYWRPDPVSGRAIWAKWVGASWHYRLDFGDGHAVNLAFWQPPVKHGYAQPGTYTMAATPDLPGGTPVRTQVTVRSTREPEATFTLIDGTTRVRATLGRVADPVRYLIEWGDGTSSEHGAGDWNPEHSYSAGFGTPTITVHDQPARRTAQFTGPDIPDPVPSGPRTHWTPLPDEGWGRLTLVGFPANTTIELGRGGETGPGSVTTDASGSASRAYQLWVPRFKFDEWRSIYVRWTDPDTKLFRQMWQPVQICEWIGGPKHAFPGCCWYPQPDEREFPRNPQNEFPITLDWATGAPHRVTVTVDPAENGRYQIAWEDSVQETVTVANGVLEETHDYGSIRDVWVIITAPSGKVARRRLRQIKPLPRTWTDGSLAIFQEYEEHSNTLGVVKACDPYGVIRADLGDGRPLVQFHRPSGVCPDRAGNGFSYAAPGNYQVTMYGPMSKPVTYIHQQKMRDHRGQGDYIIRHDALNSLSQTFHVNELKTTWYSAWFTITNTADQPTPWTLEFTLDQPAVLKDVSSWRGTATKHDLGQGRWRITCDQPAPANDSVRLDITVDPCSDPRIWPENTQVTTPRMGEPSA